MSAILQGSVYYLPLPKNTKTLLGAMADHADDDGTGVYPSHPRLALKTSDSERNVRRLVKSLMEDGWVFLVRKAAPGRAAEYRIDAERVYATADIARRRYDEEHGKDTTGKKNPTPDTTGPTPDTTGTNTGHHAPPNHHQPPSTIIKKATASRSRDLLWEQACRTWTEPAKGNDDERGRMNKAVKRFRDASCKPEELDKLKRRFEAMRPWQTATAIAVSGRIGELRESGHHGH